ncbi:MAG TPA: response regulator, partial [Burkholderiaceae bacterium]
ELLRALRLRPALANAPAVVCSADAMPDDRERALAAGFDHYWTKPIDVRELPAAITAALRSSAAPPPTTDLVAEARTAARP